MTDDKEDTFDKTKCYCDKVELDSCDYCEEFMLNPTPKFMEYNCDNIAKGNVEQECSQKEWELFKKTILNDKEKWEQFKKEINSEEEFEKWKKVNWYQKGIKP